MSSQIFYPVMQAADIFFLAGGFGTNAHMVAQLGMDQRKVRCAVVVALLSRKMENRSMPWPSSTLV